ncbi:hypothetical protein BT63DRAFT_459774 [Microthyrium microscopicum]|uniref:Uncharacterized protein n=1 Tax=Microthyrium microscopicum TaxID=703497 RepID=A0A6A6U1Z2_9PEZI|nr:hypothetical protein BT63DRAFT_459774 [Microthyrium microscopicum]
MEGLEDSTCAVEDCATNGKIKQEMEDKPVFTGHSPPPTNETSESATKVTQFWQRFLAKYPGNDSKVYAAVENFPEACYFANWMKADSKEFCCYLHDELIWMWLHYDSCLKSVKEGEAKLPFGLFLQEDPAYRYQFRAFLPEFTYDASRTSEQLYQRATAGRLTDEDRNELDARYRAAQDDSSRCVITKISAADLASCASHHKVRAAHMALMEQAYKDRHRKPDKRYTNPAHGPDTSKRTRFEEPNSVDNLHFADGQTLDDPSEIPVEDAAEDESIHWPDEDDVRYKEEVVRYDRKSKGRNGKMKTTEIVFRKVSTTTQYHWEELMKWKLGDLLRHQARHTFGDKMKVKQFEEHLKKRPKMDKLIQELMGQGWLQVDGAPSPPAPKTKAKAQKRKY